MEDKSHVPYGWAEHNGWSAAPSQVYGQSSSYSHLSGHGASASGSGQYAAPYGSLHGGHASSSAAASLFHSPAVFGAPQTVSFSAHSSSSSSCTNHQGRRASQGSQHASLRPSIRSLEAPRWIPPAPCRAAVKTSLPDETLHSQEEEPPPPPPPHPPPPPGHNGGQRSTLMREREQLLQKLAEMEKLLESLPPDDTGDDQAPHTPAQSLRSAECVSPAAVDEEKEATPDCLALAGEPGGKEKSSAESDEDNYPEFLPDSDGDLPGFKSDSDCSSRGNGDSRPSSPVDTEPVSVKTEPASVQTEPASVKTEPASVDTERTPKTSQDPSSPSRKRPGENRPLLENVVSASRLKPSQTVVHPSQHSKTRVLKKNFCPFCQKAVIKMSRHLESAHSDKVEVAVAFQYPKHSRDRMKIWNKLVNQGNFLHNKDVLKTGKGELAVRQRPQKTVKGSAFLHCLHCQGLFMKKYLFRHMKNCPQRERTGNEQQIGRKRIASRCALQMVGDLGVSDGVRDMLSAMVYDEVTQTIMEDKVLLQFAEQLLSQHGFDAKRHTQVRQNLREIARLLMEAQKTTPMKTLEHFFYPSNFPHVVSAVNQLAGYDPQKKSYSVPSLALKLGYHLQKTCGIVEANARQSGDGQLVESAQTFLSEYQKKWTKLISSSALTCLKETKSHTDTLVPLVQDVKRLQFHLEKVLPQAERNLRDHCSVENYTLLCKAALSQVILFNRRKSKEVSRLRLTNFTSRKMSKVLDDMDESVSRLERTLCQFLVRMDIRSNSGRMVPVLLKPSFISALELLIRSRGQCGVPDENPFVFARPSALSPYDVSLCILAFVRECGAERPDALSATTIRKHFCEVLQLMNLDESEARQIFGPNNDVHILRQDSKATLEDLRMESQVRVQNGKEDRTAAGTNCSVASTSRRRRTKAAQRARGSTTSSSVTERSSSSQSQEEACHNKGKQKWQPEEVGAVERHLLRFIEGHRVPQKDDCMRCLQAEPRALRTRTWKGVKDYVRNRITTLKRRSSSSAKLWKNRYQPEDEEEQEEEDEDEEED